MLKMPPHYVVNTPLRNTAQSGVLAHDYECSQQYVRIFTDMQEPSPHCAVFQIRCDTNV